MAISVLEVQSTESGSSVTFATPTQPGDVLVGVIGVTWHSPDSSGLPNRSLSIAGWTGINAGAPSKGIGAFARGVDGSFFRRQLTSSQAGTQTWGVSLSGGDGHTLIIALLRSDDYGSVTTTSVDKSGIASGTDTFPPAAFTVGPTGTADDVGLAYAVSDASPSLSGPTLTTLGSGTYAVLYATAPLAVSAGTSWTATPQGGEFRVGGLVALRPWHTLPLPGTLVIEKALTDGTSVPAGTLFTFDITSSGSAAVGPGDEVAISLQPFTYTVTEGYSPYAFSSVEIVSGSGNVNQVQHQATVTIVSSQTTRVRFTNVGNPPAASEAWKLWIID